MAATVTVIYCPRAHSDSTPCIARDGQLAASDDGRCVGCDQFAANVLRDLVANYVAR